MATADFRSDSAPPFPDRRAGEGGRGAAGDDSDVVERPRKGAWLQFRPPKDIEWNVARLPIRGLPPALEAIKIVHLTDLHLKRAWLDGYDLLLAQLERARPDLLLVTGDFVDNKRNHAAALPTLYRLLEGFRARLGCFGVLGNHDRPELGPRLGNTNVRLLTGKRELIEVEGAGGDGGGTIELIGLEGVDRRDLTQEYVHSLPPRDRLPGAVRIVLSHYPDHLKRVRSLRPDVFLAGHTHGGQCCLPGGIPILRHDSYPRRLCAGVHRVGQTWLVVGRGIGATGLPLRVFCPPEAIEIHLTRAGGEQ